MRNPSTPHGPCMVQWKLGITSITNSPCFPPAEGNWKKDPSRAKGRNEENAVVSIAAQALSIASVSGHLTAEKKRKNYTSIDPKQLRQYQWENRRSKIAVLQFENLRLVLQVGFCTSKVYLCTSEVYFCTSKVYFCTSKVYFCTSKVYFESILLYFESIFFYSKGLMCESRLLHFEIIVLQFESAVLVLQVGFCTSKVYLFISKVYFCTSKVYFCTLKV